MIIFPGFSTLSVNTIQSILDLSGAYTQQYKVLKAVKIKALMPFFIKSFTKSKD